ncbi:MAG: hypothetical protein QOE61_408, partial [Micromonosporaceae bacterium]|nr:hypothetical protein [Micromonosporaceae bacterium]
MVGGVSVRVFISYAYDSPEHVDAVRALWELLRSLGIDAKLDRSFEGESQDWPLWMLEQFREADFVIVVASDGYRRRADGIADADDGRGVQFEAGVLRDLVMGDRRAWSKRILTV